MPKLINNIAITTQSVLMNFDSDFFNSEPTEQTVNSLLQYLQQQHPETLARIAQSASPEI